MRKLLAVILGIACAIASGAANASGSCGGNRYPPGATYQQPVLWINNSMPSGTSLGGDDCNSSDNPGKFSLEMGVDGDLSIIEFEYATRAGGRSFVPNTSETPQAPIVAPSAGSSGGTSWSLDELFRLARGYTAGSAFDPTATSSGQSVYQRQTVASQSSCPLNAGSFYSVSGSCRRWHTDTGGHTGDNVFLWMLSDGNVCVWNPVTNQPLWCTGNGSGRAGIWLSGTGALTVIDSSYNDMAIIAQPPY